MIYKTNLTQKGQLTVPKAIRDELKLKPNIQVVVWLESRALRIETAQTVLDLAGTFNPKKTVNAVSLRQKMAKNYGPR